MNIEQRLEELRARLTLMKGTATLLLVVVPTEAAVDETRTILSHILQATPIAVADIGRIGHDIGPAKWVELTRKQSAEAYLFGAVPAGLFSASAFATLANAEREYLRDLAGPVVLLISQETELSLRQRAPDFVTWAAAIYELPAPAEFLAIARKMGAIPTSSERHKKEEKPLRFLHLSDFHLRTENLKRFDQDKVLRGLIEFLAIDHERFPLDAIFITGDLGYSGKRNEYELVVELLHKLIEVTRVPRERVFVVPGNHDVDRRAGKWFLRTLPDPETADAFFLEDGPGHAHARKFEAYRAALGSALGSNRALGLGVGKDAVEIIDWDDTRIAVASFNSAWFAQGDDDQGKLWLGEANVTEAIDRIADEKAKFAIALFHHPLEHLDERDRDSVEARFERSFDLILRGHLHKDRSKVISSQRGGYVEVAAPAAYQTSTLTNGCFLGEIRPCARTIRLFPYRFAKSTDRWVLDTSVFPDDASNGYAHTFEAREKQKLPAVYRKAREKAAEQVVQAMSPNAKQQMANELGWQDSPKNRMSSSDITKKITRMARTASEDPALWWDPNQARKLDQAIGEAAAEEAVAEMGKFQKISAKDPGFLEKALQLVARVFKAPPLQVLENRSEAERVIIFNSSIAAILRRVVDGSVSHRSRIGSDGIQPDILIGALDSHDPRAAIVVKMMRSFASYAPDLADLEECTVATRSSQGALILIADFGKKMPMSGVERVKTHTGRDVLLLHLPLQST